MHIIAFIVLLLILAGITSKNPWISWPSVVVASILLLSVFVYVIALVTEFVFGPDVFISEKRKKEIEIKKQEDEERLERKRVEKEKTIELALKFILSVVEKHREELTLQRKLTTVTKKYGKVDTSLWEKERFEFIQNVVVDELARSKFSYLAEEIIEEYYSGVVLFIQNITADFDKKSNFSDDMDPVQYEHLVADTLKELGWKTRTTKGSGDQGIDVIATMNGKKLVIQCKLYSSNVGNAAVQEIVAGKAYEQAQFAAVVTNAKFTRSAIQLAKANDVFLLHHDQLHKLKELCFGS